MTEERIFGWRECVAVLIGLAVVAGLAAAFGHYDCHHVQANVSSPEPGTPRANYCSPADSWSGWAMFLVPIVGAAIAFVAVGRRRERVLAAAATFAALAVVNALVIMFLSPENTV